MCMSMSMSAARADASGLRCSCSSAALSVGPSMSSAFCTMKSTTVGSRLRDLRPMEGMSTSGICTCNSLYLSASPSAETLTLSTCAPGTAMALCCNARYGLAPGSRVCSSRKKAWDKTSGRTICACLCFSVGPFDACGKHVSSTYGICSKRFKTVCDCTDASLTGRSGARPGKARGGKGRWTQMSGLTGTADRRGPSTRRGDLPLRRGRSDGRVC